MLLGGREWCGHMEGGYNQGPDERNDRKKAINAHLSPGLYEESGVGVMLY